MGNSEREIESLIYAYAERFDLGDLDGVAALFSDGRIQAAPGVVYEGSEQVRVMYAVSYTHLDVYKRQGQERVYRALVEGAFDSRTR